MKKALVILLSVLIVLSFVGCANDKEVLNVYNWGEYIDMAVIDMFEDETGIKVNYNTSQRMRTCMSSFPKAGCHMM
jgi:spermidine/putrescine transport system substrate-binding protein